MEQEITRLQEQLLKTTKENEKLLRQAQDIYQHKQQVDAVNAQLADRNKKLEAATALTQMNVVHSPQEDSDLKDPVRSMAKILETIQIRNLPSHQTRSQRFEILAGSNRQKRRKHGSKSPKAHESYHNGVTRCHLAWRNPISKGRPINVFWLAKLPSPTTTNSKQHSRKRSP